MEEEAKIFGFDKVEDFAQFLISRARKEKLSISIKLSERACEINIEPLEHVLYLCPHYGETRKVT